MDEHEQQLLEQEEANREYDLTVRTAEATNAIDERDLRELEEFWARCDSQTSELKDAA